MHSGAVYNSEMGLISEWNLCKPEVPVVEMGELGILSYEIAYGFKQAMKYSTRSAQNSKDKMWWGDIDVRG